MPHSLIISDLHLSAGQPHSAALFRRFISEIAPKAESLYILGDFFEYWAGDDALEEPFHQEICTHLARLAGQGVRISIMHGNRDFLMGERLADACQATLLPDPNLIDLYGTPTVLSHGDALCTDDTAYQQFRGMVRNPQWQAQFLAQPLAQRTALIESIREQSESQKQVKEMAIMDVNADAVAELLRTFHYPRLIHGHTHRPDKHIHEVDGHSCERWVLADWDRHANALRCDAQGIARETYFA